MSSFKMFTAKLFISLPIIVILAITSISQTVTGTISGTVTDSSGGVLPNATVTLISDQAGNNRNVNTNTEGRFTFSAVQPGTYTVRVEQNGFQTLLRKNTVLSANESLALGDVALTAGNVNETVTVTSEGAMVEADSSDLTARLTSDQIALISTKGRDVTSLLRLIPGTSNDDDIEAVGEGFGTNLPTISGQRGRSNVPTIDGLNAGEPSGSNKLSMSINQDAVAEVKILRNNYAAEYGNNGGAIINIISKGGTKEYRGSAYYFLRNEALNASPFFTNKAGLQRPLYRHNIWGFNFGGPLPMLHFGENDSMFLKNRAFFFISYEKPHTITPVDPVFVTVPTALERQGDFSQSLGLPSGGIIDPATGLQFTGNKIPSTRWNSNGALLLNIFPMPNVPFSQKQGTTGNSNLYNYVIQHSVDVPKRSAVIRFDFKLTKNDTAYWKAQWFTSDNVGFGTSGWPSGDANRWGINSHYLYKDNGWPGSFNWVHIFNSSIVNEFNFGMRHDSEGFVPAAGETERFSRATVGYTAPQLFPINNSLGTIPRVTSWTSVVGTPANINWLDRWGAVGNDYIHPSFADNISINHGNHNLKFGLYFERLKNSEARGGNWTGTFSFSNSTSGGFTVSTPTSLGTGNTGFAYANALLGDFNSYSESSSRPFTNLELKLFQWYGQDQWKINSHLTFNYGLRFGYHSPFFQIDKQGSNFDPSLYNPANAPLLYDAYCVGQPNGIPALGTSCSTANQRAIDPRTDRKAPTPSQLLSRFLVRSFVPGVGNTTNGLAIGTDPNTPKGYRKTPSIDYEPRVGLAWDLTGKQQTVVRGMFGIYHSPRVGGGTTGGNLVNNPPSQTNFTINNGNIADIASLVASGAAVNFPSSINAVEVMSHTPTTYNFSLGVQQYLGFGTVIEASYVGSLSRWLGERRNINQVPDAARFVDCAAASLYGVTCHPENRDPFSATAAKNNDFLRPYRGFGDINQVTWSGTSNYNALQVQVNRRYAKGFQYGLAYTYSKSLDYANDDSSDVNNGRPYKAFNYGLSDFDQTHILTVNYIYDIPFFNKNDNGFVRALLGGWEISGTTSFATGKPKDFSVTFSSGTVNVSDGQTCPDGSIAGKVANGLTPCVAITDFTGGTINALPFITCNPNKGATGSDSTGTPYVINRSCFQRPTRLGNIGDQPRNLGRRPNIFNSDLAFFKNFRWGEKRGIQLRWEMYNIFNRANFTDFDGGLTYGIRQNQSDTSLDPATNKTRPCRTATNGSTNVCTAFFDQTNDRFGSPTAARAPRIMQASIRINF